MDIKEFIKGYNQNGVNFLKLHVIRKYIPYEQKIAIAKAIVKTTMKTPTGDFVRNTPAVYMNYSLSLVRDYTDVEIDPKESLATFNLLEKEDVFSNLIEAIGEDARKLDTVVKMVINDEINNHCDLVNFMTLKSDNVNIILDKFKDALAALPVK